MNRYVVLRPFDFYQPGQEMSADDVSEQHQRGNLSGLVDSGFIVALADPEHAAGPQYAAMSYRELQAAAKEAGLKASGSRADLISRLTNADN